MYTRSRSSTGGPGSGFGGARGPMNSGNFQGQHGYNNHQGGNYQQQSNYKPGNFKSSGAPSPMQQQQNTKNRQQNQNQNQQNQNQNQQNQIQNQQNPNQNQQNPNQNQQGQQQQGLAPTTPKLKPILKQTTPSGPAASAGQQTPSTPAPVPPPTVAAAANASPAPAANASPAPAANAAAVSTPNNPPKPNPVAAAAATTTAAAAAPAAVKPSPATPAAKSVPAPQKTAASAAVTAPVAAAEFASNSAADPQNAGNVETVDGMDGDDAQMWMEDDQGKWMDTDDQSGQWMDTADGQQQIPKWRRYKKLSANKPNKKLKRLRMNQRLRKTLMPKNAIMVLNEMKAGVQFTFPETQAIMPNSLFLVHAELEGKVYVGQGLSKPLARQNAAENALKCLLLEKMTAAAMKERVDADGDNSMEASTEGSQQAEGQQQPAATPNEGEAATAEETTPEEGDDIPWSSLASFALYKLFLEWQNQGTVVPIPRPGVPPLPKNRADPKPPTEKVLPANALEIHPVMLLNQMRPGTTYNEVGRVGNPPNIQFTLGVEINGQSFTGSAKNKKDAKKLAAKAALKALYNLEYPEENKPEVGEVAQ